jgi:hypothetical protein
MSENFKKLGLLKLRKKITAERFMHFLLALIELRVEKNFGIAPFLESRGSVTWSRSHDMFYRQKEFLKHDFLIKKYFNKKIRKKRFEPEASALIVRKNTLLMFDLR